MRLLRVSLASQSMRALQRQNERWEGGLGRVHEWMVF
jgi:hypothetical protein